MKKSNKTHKHRVKKRLFPLSVFVASFGVFGLFTTVQMKILGAYIAHNNVPTHLIVAVICCWIFAAITFTVLTRHQISTRYEKPIKIFAQAAEKVAQGDFSVYLPARHTADKWDYIDIIFLDFNKMVEALGSIETLKTDFLSNVSHEIKTPLAVMQNTAQLLKKPNMDLAQQQAYLSTIEQACKRLSDLVANILKLNKLENQAMQPLRDTVDISSQLCECALQFEAVWERENICFEAQVEDQAMMICDASLLELVWNNLLSNAFKFTPSGGCVTVRQWHEDSMICVSITDTGCGMSEQTMDHIFDKFYQGDTSHAMQGNGLGLALVHRVLELVDGTIQVQSRQGEGTTFKVCLPNDTARIEGGDRA